MRSEDDVKLSDCESPVTAGYTLNADHISGRNVYNPHIVEQNEELAELLRFYGADSGSVSTEEIQTFNELPGRKEKLRQLLCTA